MLAKKVFFINCLLSCFHLVGTGLFAIRNLKKGEEITRFGFPNFVSAKECGRTQYEREDWWGTFATLNALPYDNVIFQQNGLVYDFAPPGDDKNQWFWINHSSLHANATPKWNGRQMIFRATKNIRKNQEILFCYNNHQTPPDDWIQ